ncbi:hypothetical protein [Antarctobacter sp.]|uniref:hypothetical protein n=1 Tax=Antarctobacter sp. TaxID=1872577 RepID=UPI002B2708F2|nr:hypothetical protein [Antarctobacter sp.]
MVRSRGNDSSSRRAERSDDEVADLARGANGLGEPADPQEIAQGLLKAQMEAMNTMMSASVDMTAATLKAMTQMWGMGAAKRPDEDEDR